MFDRADVEETSRLKYHVEPDPHSRRRPSGIPILESAIESSKVYKKQTVHESRTRPIDRKPRPHSTLFPMERNDIEEAKFVKSQDQSAIYSEEPNRFYLLKI